MKNILYLKTNNKYISMEVVSMDETYNKIIKSFNLFKDYESMKAFIHQRISSSIAEKYGYGLNKDSLYRLKMEIDSSLRKRMIHCPNLSLEDNRKVTVFEIFTRDETLLIDDLDIRLIREIIEKYNLLMAKGEFEIYNSFAFYECGLMYEIDRPGFKKSQERASLDISFMDSQLSFDKIDIFQKGSIVINYEVQDGQLNASLVSCQDDGEKKADGQSAILQFEARKKAGPEKSQELMQILGMDRSE